MGDRFLTFDRIELNKSMIKADNEDEFVVGAVIASEIVQNYSDGRAFKSAEELAKAAWTADGRFVKIFSHPAEGTLMKREDISGQIHNPRFVKDLKDPKTGRPIRRGIVADIHFFKHDRGKDGAKAVPPEVLEKIKNGELCDVSIGFTFDKDTTPGKFNEQDYDYAQRNIFLDHVAAAIDRGRCPSPYCGLGADSNTSQPRFIGLDPWETTEQYIRSGHRNPSDFDSDSLRTIDLSASEGIKAIVGCPNGKFEGGKCSVGMEIQSYLFDIKKWDMARARAWFEKHRTDSVMEFDCPVCDKIRELGPLEFSTRLTRYFGRDAILTALTPASTTLNQKWSTDSTNTTVSIMTTDQPRDEAKAAQEARPKVEDIIEINRKKLDEVKELIKEL